MSRSEYDVVVIGAGSTGENVADVAVRGGLSAVLVESGLVGGECSYHACMPSKVLLRAGQVLGEAGAVDGARQAVAGGPDVAAVFRRRDAFTHGWDDASQVAWVDGAGIDLLRGTGRISGEREVTVTAADGAVTVVRARHAVAVTTGSVPFVPPVEGLAEAAPWTSRDATGAHAVPRRLVILGGGVVGVEMATAYASLGAEDVVLVEGGPRILARHEEFASVAVAGALRHRGVGIHTGRRAVAVRRPVPGGEVTVVLDSGDELIADEVLVAAGRRAATTGIGVEAVGLEPGASIEVDDTMRAVAVAGGWLYAAGDVNGRVLLTHQGKYQARVAGAAIVARARGERVDGGAWQDTSATADHAAVPQVVFSDPEIAAAGLTESDARAAGIPVRVVDYEIGDVAGAAVYADGYAGHARLVVDAARDVLVGATFVGPGVGEMIHAATVAIVGEVPLARLWHAVPSYPTISEVWLRLLEADRYRS